MCFRLLYVECVFGDIHTRAHVYIYTHTHTRGEGEDKNGTAIERGTRAGGGGGSIKGWPRGNSRTAAAQPMDDLYANMAAMRLRALVPSVTGEYILDRTNYLLSE